jgi:pentose-5-phosphate-3-epimerase
VRRSRLVPARTTRIGPVPWHDWIRTVEVEPSCDTADGETLEAGVEALLRAGCRLLHLHVRGEGAGSTRVQALATLLHRYGGILDVHLRSDDPTAAFSALAAAGADSVTFDADSVDDPAAAIPAARACDVQVGIAFQTDVEIEEVVAAADGADLVLFESEGPPVVEFVRRVAPRLPRGVEIQVEGDISFDNIRSLWLAGARLLVVHAPIFEREDLPRAYRRLVQALA